MSRHLNQLAKIIFPKAGSTVKSSFFVIGWISKACIRPEYPLKLGVSGEGFGLDTGRAHLLFPNLEKVWFWASVDTSWLNLPDGEIITLELSGYDGEFYGDLVNVPLAIQTHKRPVLQEHEVIKKHATIQEAHARLDEYRKKIGEVYAETEYVINPEGENSIHIILPDNEYNVSSLKNGFKENSDLRIRVIAEGERRAKLTRLDQEYGKELLLGATGGEPSIEFLLHAANIASNFIFVWAIKHTISDIDNAVWGSLKMAFRKLLSLPFRSKDKKEGRTAFAIEGNLLKGSLIRRSVVFLVEESLDESEIDKHLDKAIEVVRNIDPSELENDMIVFKLENQKWVKIK